MRKIGIFILLLSFFIVSTVPARSDELDDINKKLEELNKARRMSVEATKPLESTLKKLESDLAQIQAQVKNIETDLMVKEKKIKEGESQLKEQEELFEKRTRSFYIKSSNRIPALELLAGNSAIGEMTRHLAYRQAAIDLDKKIIANLVDFIVNLETKKKELEIQKVKLSAIKAETDKQAAFFKKEVAGAKSYQENLSKEIAGLSARQQQLLAEKTGSFQISVGDVPAADDPASRPDYNPGFSPAFAGFSFGAPHRRGMSQYGAFGRAKSGGDVGKAENILSAYYPGTELKKDYRTDINIRVRDYDTSWNIEDYVKRIYEVPNSWGDEGGYESLKAQAVAARSYALAYTNNGSGSICATESCQVAKREPKGGNWERAVNDTRGWVLVSGGQPYSAWYAASSGGYNTPGGWDTKCGSRDCWTGEAYEKIAGSPWFYKAWYKPRYRAASRSHPWLNKDEFADIVNAVSLYQKDNGAISHLSQTDKSNSDTWNRDEVKNRLGGEAVSDVSGISVSYSSGGYTASVHLSTDRGGKDIDGSVFREIFNLRAPGEIWLASSLYNFEKK